MICMSPLMSRSFTRYTEVRRSVSLEKIHPTIWRSEPFVTYAPQDSKAEDVIEGDFKLPWNLKQFKLKKKTYSDWSDTRLLIQWFGTNWLLFSLISSKDHDMMFDTYVNFQDLYILISYKSECHQHRYNFK